MNDTRAFFSSAKSLARNPLGILALFILLIYGVAGLVLSLSASKLQGNEKLPLVWFIVLFPVLVLVAFYRLVSKHHGKLYAPGDYKMDASFLQTLPEDQKSERLTEEIESSEISQITPPAEQTRTVNHHYPDIAASARPTSNETLRTEYELVERLALRKLEQTYGLNFLNQVTFGEGRATAFDGVAEKGDQFIAVEVKFLRRPFLSPLLLREALYRGVMASSLVHRKSENKHFQLFIVLVTDFAEKEDLDKVQRQASKLIKDAPLHVDLLVFRLDELKREFDTLANAWHSG